MGAASATLGISCDTTSCTGGASIAGKVYLNVAKEVDASHLQIALVGEERTTVRYTESRGSGKNRRTVTKYVHACHTFLLRRWNLAEFADNKAQVGQFEYEFNFTLPATDDLPSTFYTAANGGKAQVTYYVETRLHKTGWFSWDTTASRVIQVTIPSPPVKPVESAMVQSTIPVRLCCCINKGEMDLKAMVNKDAFMTGDKMDILYEARNQSTAEVQHISVKLIEHVRWKAGSHGDGKRFVHKEQFPGTKLNEGERYISLEEDPATLVVPATYRSSFKGQLMSCSHRLEVKLNTGFGISNPEVDIGIQVYDQNVGMDPDAEKDNGADEVEGDPDEGGFKETGATEMPAGWQGVVVPAVNLDDVNVCEQLGGIGNPVIAVPVQALEVEASPAEGSKFCGSCGQPAEGMKFCASCGNRC